MNQNEKTVLLTEEEIIEGMNAHEGLVLALAAGWDTPPRGVCRPGTVPLNNLSHPIAISTSFDLHPGNLKNSLTLGKPACIV